MASDDSSAPGQTCTPCRGTGQLISGLGGKPHQVVCPWCRGTGQRIPGIDAQEHPAEAGGQEETAEAIAQEHPAEAGGRDAAAAPGATPVT